MAARSALLVALLLHVSALRATPVAPAVDDDAPRTARRLQAATGSDPGAVSLLVNQLASSKAGYVTYQVAVEFDPVHVLDVYGASERLARSFSPPSRPRQLCVTPLVCAHAVSAALFGEGDNPLGIPAAFQVPAPFGSDVGPVRWAGLPARQPTASASRGSRRASPRASAGEPRLLPVQPGCRVRLVCNDWPGRARGHSGCAQHRRHKLRIVD